MDEAHKGTIHLSTFEDERRRLKVENQYLRWILDTLHKNITVRDAEPQLESQPLEVLVNDQPLIDLTTNVWNVTHKFYNLEMELDYTCRRISQLSTMIVGGEGSEVTPSPKKNNKITATGRKPRSSRDQTTEQSEQSLKLEKDLELIASAWRDMKDKERKVKDLEEEKRELQEELSSKEVIIMKLKDKRDRNVLTQDQLTDIEIQIEVAEENLRLQREVNARMVKNTEMTEKALVEKMTEYTKLETDKKKLETKHEELKQMNRETLKEKQTLEELNTRLEHEVSRLRHDVNSLKHKAVNLKIFYIQQIEAGSSTIQNQAHIIQQLNEEMERLRTRLSTIASDRLTHENVNIADLSDADRPTNLSEVYSELYDNEWTDAFEELTSKGQLSEKRSIEFLLEILLNAYQKCRQMTWDRYEAMKSVAITLDVINANSFLSNKRLEIRNVPNHQESKSNRPPKVPEPVNQPSSSPSLEQKQQQIPLEAIETADYEIIWSGKKAPHGQELNHKSNTTFGLQDLNQVGDMDISWIPSTTTSCQECSKDKKNANCISEDKKESRDQGTIQLSLSVEEEKEIKTVWKKMSNAIKTRALELLRCVLITGLDINDKDMPSLSKYLIRCVEICWKMGLQEKPLQLDIEAEKKDGLETMFDAEKFRAYTKTGKRVDYIVWPALFLHEGGAMLSKGIAQGY